MRIRLKRPLFWVARPLLLGFDIVPFAIDDCGDPFFLRPGADEPDTVYIAYHEPPGKTTVVAESMADMLARLRSEKANSGKEP